MEAVDAALVGEYDFEFRALSHAVRYREWIHSAFAPYLRGRVIEVGCGVGQFTHHLLQTPGLASIDAIEPDASLARQFSVADPRVTLRAGVSQQFSDPSMFDAAVSVNVLEHIEKDEEELRHYAHLLKPGIGHLCILVPARMEIYSPIDKKFGHWRRYSTTGLRAKLERAGFRIVSLSYFNLVGYFTWLVVFKLLRSLSFKESSMQVFDRFVVPVARIVDRLPGAKLLGQSVIAVATPRE
jgi:SAM-dependent methyltransferase